MAPNPALLVGLAREMLDDLPVPLRDDPDVQAAIYCHAKEAERQEATLEHLRAQFFPQLADELGLPWWESLLRTTVAPPGMTVAERRTIVMAMLAKLRAEASGLNWQAAVEQLVGPGWTHREHDPDDPTSPPPYTLVIRLPFPPEADRYQRTEALLRAITPAHLDLIVSSAEGFVLDQSQLDQEAMRQ